MLQGGYRVAGCASGGWLFLPSTNGADSYWLPRAPILRELDGQGHVLEERELVLRDFSISATELAVKLTIPAAWTMDCVMWRFSGAMRDVVEELQQPHTLETQAYFVWGSHTIYQRPADVYLHLTHGHVYENRPSWPKRWKICSENDAHALYTILSGLMAATGKRLYGLLTRQLLLSVLDRQGEDGGWRHGEWSDGMESHYRLHCSAMHLLMDALDAEGDRTLRSALEHAAAFLARQTDKLDKGTWFLHDELEHSLARLREGPFRWVPSHALGKSESNMLVLNTHLDATVALDRYGKIMGDSSYGSLVTEAVSATRSVLEMRPAEWLYRPLFRAIRLTFLPTKQAAGLPIYLRALKRVTWKYLLPMLSRIKARLPRLVMPGGYIERELSLQSGHQLSYDYLAVNLMDLLRYRRHFSEESVDESVRAAFDLITNCRMLERWLETSGKEYGAGFWAEALYQICLLRPDERFRSSLAEVVLAMERGGLGLPPSLLGANGEAIAKLNQLPTPIPKDGRIRVVNLSRTGVVELLIVNCAAEAIPSSFERNVPENLLWSVGDSEQLSDEPPRDIPPGSWLWGRYDLGKGVEASCTLA